MKIRYKGGRSHYEVSYNRKPYYFTLQNNRTVDIQEQAVINYIFSLPNRTEFEAVIEEPKPQPEIEIKEEVIKKTTKPKKRKGGK